MTLPGAVLVPKITGTPKCTDLGPQTNKQTRQPKQINKTKLARQTKYELYSTHPLRHCSTAPLGRPGGMRGAVESAAPRRGAGRAGPGEQNRLTPLRDALRNPPGLSFQLDFFLKFLQKNKTFVIKILFEIVILFRPHFNRLLEDPRCRKRCV